ncbi:MAG: LacI family DNA-binding transcriptional regulator [Clostridia bacterium]|nr:LacI family DNA-binding transcriptional regulator [Clostridia bacterium]
MKRINSSDIARMAGVSRSTVSRVINNYSNVPENTRRKVMQVIKENNYYPQLSGQILAGMKQKTIGIFWAGSNSLASDSLSSSYFMHMLDAAKDRGYLVLACILEDLSKKENYNFVRKTYAEGRIDAGVFVGASYSDPLMAELIEGGEIVGVFDYRHKEQEKYKCVTVNYETDSGDKAIDYLYQLGHRDIAIIDGNMTRLSSITRHEGHMRSMQAHGLPIRNEWLTYGGITIDSGYKAARHMLENTLDHLPTAICANNDAVAFGVYRACGELGISIPGDISVIGVDGHADGTHSQPPLTTIAFDAKGMFSSLVDRTIRKIQQEDDVVADEVFKGKLIERASCRKI